MERRYQLWIVLAASIAMFANLGATRLWDQDEAYFAGTAAEMHQRGDWIVPYFNQELFAHKPPLMFWMMIVGRELFGPTEFAARFFSAIFGIGTALLTYHLARKLFSAQVGLWAGLAISTSLMFDVVARAATPDSFLVFFITLALYLFVRSTSLCDPQGTSDGERDISGEEGVRCRKNPFLPTSSWAFVASFVAMGLAVLVKGPIGVLLPMASIGLFLLLTNPGKSVAQGQDSSETRWRAFLTFAGRFSPARFFRTLWSMRPLLAVGIILFVAGPWFVLVGMKTEGQFLKEFFGVHNFGRFLQPMDSHRGTIFYYVPAILAGFFPWSIFALPTLLFGIKKIRTAGSRESAAYLFVGCWATVVIGFFSLASTKLPSYVLPAYPAIAILTACLFDAIVRKSAEISVWWPRAALLIYALVGASWMIALPVVSSLQKGQVSLLESAGLMPEINHELWVLAPLGFIPFVGGAVCLILLQVDRRRAMGISLSISAVLFMVATFAGGAVRIDRFQTSESIAQSIEKMSSEEEVNVAQYGYFQPSLTYYTQQRVEPCKSELDASRFLEQTRNSFLITTDQRYARIKDQLPAGVEILAREKRFPKQGQVLVLGHPARMARTTSSSSAKR